MHATARRPARKRFAAAREAVRCLKRETKMNASQTKPELATLAGGCFWCLEAVFEDIDGVLGIESGYTGGTTQTPRR